MKVSTVLLLFICLLDLGCSGRKIKASVTDDPSYDPNSKYGKTLSGPNFSVRTFSQDGVVSAELMSSVLTAKVRDMLEPKGFKYVEKVEDANILFLLTTNSTSSNIAVPAQAYWGMAFNRDGGGGGGGFVGAHNEVRVAQWIDLRVLDCGATTKPKIVSEGRANPKSYHDSFLANQEHMELAIKKLLDASVFNKLSEAPKQTSIFGCKETLGKRE